MFYGAFQFEAGCTMKIKVVANRLVDTDIEWVSLVRHGANRVPFQLIKSEDSTLGKLGDKLNEFFSLADAQPEVVAYFIKADVSEKLLPIIKQHETVISEATEDGVTVATVSKGRSRGFIQLTDTVALSIDKPIPEFSDESIVKAYAEGLGLEGFAPGVDMSTRGLAHAVWSFLNNHELSRDERVLKVDGMLASFRKYIAALSGVLPEKVFNVEAALIAATPAESDVADKKLTEVAKGDLDGLLDEVAVATEEVVAVAEVAPEAEAVAEVAKEETTETAPVEASVTPEEAPSKLDQVLGLLNGFTDRFNALEKSVTEVSDRVEKAEAVARAAVVKAEKTTLVRKDADDDLVLSTLGGVGGGKKPVAKNDESLWDGALQGLENFRPYGRR